MARTETHECRNCGAPLGIPADHDRYFTCRSCGSVLEDTTSSDDRAAGTISISIARDVPIDVASLSAYTAPARAAGQIIGLAVIVAIIALVVGGGFAVSSAVDALNGSNASARGVGTGSGTKLDIYNYAAAAPLESDDGSGADVIALARTSDGAHLVYADLDDDPVLRWAVPLELEDEVFTQFVAAAGLIVVGADRELLAFDRATGAERWAAALSDEVAPNLCQGCLAVYGGGVVSLTADGVLSSHSLASGEQLWATTLTATPRQVLPLGSDPAVLDEVDGVVHLRVLAAADGTPVANLPISCPDTTFGGRNEPSIYTTLHAVPDRSVLYVADPSFGGCAQRWVAGSAVPAWEVAYAFPDPSGPEGGDVVPTDTSAVIASGRFIDEIDLATGATRRVGEVPDADLAPIGVADGVVVVAAKSTRGSADWTIEGIDLASGARRWTFAPEAGQRIEPEASYVSGDGWAAAMTSAGVSVVEFREESESLVVQSLPVATGTTTPAVDIDLSGRGFTLSLWMYGWRGDMLTTAVSGVFVLVDTTDGSIVAEGP